MKKIITIMFVLTTSFCMLCSCGTSNKKNSAKQPTKETIENSDNIKNESTSNDNESNKDNSNKNESLTDPYFRQVEGLIGQVKQAASFLILGFNPIQYVG